MTNFVTIEGRELRRAMRLIVAVIEKHNIIPILGYAKISLTNESLRIHGTDLDMEAVVTADAIDGAGIWDICISAAVLEGLGKVAGVMPVRIELPGGTFAKIIVGDGDAVYEINTLPASDYPSWPDNRGDVIETFTNGMFAVMLDKVKWCISTEETRYYLNGVAWQTREDGKRLVATDGHRLAVCRYEKEPQASSAVTSRIIPRRTVAILSDHFAGLEVRVHSVSKGNEPEDKMLDFVSRDAVLRTRLIDGTFPDIDRLIPIADGSKIDIKRDDLMKAIERANVVSGRERSRAIQFHNDKGRVAVSRRNVDFGNCTSVMSAIWPDDRVSSFCFNGQYMKEIAASCGSSLTLHIVDSNSPFRVTDDDDTMTRVIMPMRV